MLERKIQTYTTNESGQKIVTYQGQGLGERKLVVQKNGRTVSETLPILDCKYIFAGISNKTSRATITDNEDGSYTIGTDGTGDGIMLLSTTTSSSNAIFADIGECIEFDIISHTGTVIIRMNVSGGSNREITRSGSKWSSSNHVKLTVVENGVSVQFDNETPTIVSLEDTGARDFRIRLDNASSSVTLKNLRYY